MHRAPFEEVDRINPFSFLATVSATYFAMLVYQRAAYSGKSKQNTLSLLVLASLGWWCLCDAFFYAAPTVDDAWLWHRLGAPGWCGFAAFTSYYFIVMTGFDRRMPRAAKAAFWVVPAVLVLRFMLFEPTGIADGLVPSGIGWGWTYEQSFSTPWPYVFLTYLVAYFAFALQLLHRWGRVASDRLSRELARGFIVLDVAAVGVGFVSMYVVPQLSTYLPPMGFAATMVFGLWYWIRLRDYDFEFVELALNPSYVYESCIDGLVVTDDRLIVLYANGEARRLLGSDDPVGAPLGRFVAPASRGEFEAMAASGAAGPARATLLMAGGVPAVCSASRTKVRGGRFDVCLVHLSDVSQLQRARDELEYLAYHDAMTGVSNRRQLDDLLAKRVRGAESEDGDFALLFIDVADFKHVNDTYGHAVGDAALVAVAEALERAAGPGEEVVRFAGDEFVVLGRADDEADLAERLRAAVDGIDLEAIAPGLRIGVDMGSCRYSEAGGADALLSLADARMYAHKHAR